MVRFIGLLPFFFLNSVSQQHRQVTFTVSHLLTRGPNESGRPVFRSLSHCACLYDVLKSTCRRIQSKVESAEVGAEKPSQRRLVVRFQNLSAAGPNLNKRKLQWINGIGCPRGFFFPLVFLECPNLCTMSNSKTVQPKVQLQSLLSNSQITAIKVRSLSLLLILTASLN